MLKQAGYNTAVVGKWHLGLGDASGVDWNKEIKPGPREIGFDYSFIMAAAGDRLPCVYVEDGKVVGLDPADPIKVSYKQPFPGEPTGVSHRDQLKLDWSHGHNMAVVNGVGGLGQPNGFPVEFRGANRANVAGNRWSRQPERFAGAAWRFANWP